MRKLLYGFLGILFMIGVFLFVQTTGRYLIQELSQEQQWESEESTTDKRVILHLPTAEYYTLHLGIFQQKEERDQLVQELQKEGYTVAVNQNAPYQAWLGCIGTSLEKEEEEAWREKFPDCSVEEKVLNQVSFSYWENNSSAEQIVSIIYRVDTLLKHSLKTFHSMNVQNYNQPLLVQMVAELKQETAETIGEVISVFQPNHFAWQEGEQLQAALQAYENKLNELQQHPAKDTALLNAENALQYLIVIYHDGILSMSENEMKLQDDIM